MAEEKDKKNAMIMWKLCDLERAHTSTPVISAICGAYVLMLSHRCPGAVELKDILEKADVPKRLVSYLVLKLENHWQDYAPLLTAFTEEELCDFFASTDFAGQLGFKGGAESSLPICELVNGILEPKRGEDVCDLGCCIGDYLRSAYFHAEGFKSEGKFVGFEFNPDLAALAAIRMRSDDIAAEVVWDDFFNPRYCKERFDKVFANPPMCMSVRDTAEISGFIREAFPDFPEIPSSVSSADWLFVARAAAAMKKGGKAVVVLPASAMMTKQSEAYRRYFVQRNMIEAVIELPDRLLGYTAISTFLVVLSEGNESVKMIRAGNLCERGRSNNVLTKDGIARICESLRMKPLGDRSFAEERNDICAETGKADLLEESCVLTVLRHFADPMALRQGIQFGALIKNAKRGAAITSKELDDLVCDVDTGVQYISTGNINDGAVDATLMNLREMPRKYAPYCVRNGDVMIARVMANSSMFKVAVAELPEGRTLLPNGNILVITTDPEKTDPYFIKSCLESEYAQRYLRNSSVGNMVKTLHYKSLEMLPIPVLPLERQKEIGDKCRAAVRAVIDLRSRLGKAKEELGSILSANAADCFIGLAG